jgi:glycosyltransferase involved in cell wall biosynthesis
VKVLLLVVGLDVGGTEAHVLELASRIDQSTFEVVVCSLKPLGRLGRELCARGIRVVTLNGAGKFDVRVLGRLRRVLLTERPDVIQAFLFWANIAARLLSRLVIRCSVISSYHDEVVPEGWFNRMIDRATMKWTKYIVCCSAAVQTSVRQRIGGTQEQCVVIPFGVDADRFCDVAGMLEDTIVLESGLPVIGSVCRLVEPKKGIKYLLEAVAQLEQEAGKPVCQVLLVGEGPARQSIRTLSERLGISPRVSFLGVRRDIPEILSLMNIFLLPSLYEGFGIAILEAMAAGKPVVATTVGGIPEFVIPGQSGLLVPPGDALALARAIKQLLDEPEKARAMGSQGQKHVRQHYSIGSMVRRHEQLYELCLSKSS